DKSLPCLTLSNLAWQKIVETDASNIGFGGILKQINPLCIIGRNSPIIQRGGMSLVKLKTSQKEASSSSIHLEDIPEDNPLYAELWAYLSQKEKGDIFASIAKEDINDIKSYEKVAKKEIIFLL
ncbi:hypothetical protein MTR67_007341, partial [Solanum verrucosum]